MPLQSPRLQTPDKHEERKQIQVLLNVMNVVCSFRARKLSSLSKRANI